MYNKIFTQILDSSIWLEPNATRIVWLTFLAAMDEDGYAHFASIQNLAHRAIVTLDECKKAVDCLELPDPNSSDADNDGKRIEKVPGGWIVLNAVKYREIVTRSIAKEKTRVRVQRYRERNASVTPSNASCNAHVTPSEAVSVSEVHKLPSEEKESPERKNQSARSTRGCCAEFEDFWASLPKQNRIAKGRTRESWTKAIRNGATVEQIISGVASYARYEKKKKAPGGLQATTSFNLVEPRKI